MAAFFSLFLSALSESTAFAWAVFIHESDSLLWQLLHFFRPSNGVSAEAVPAKTINNTAAASANRMGYFGYFTGPPFVKKTIRGRAWKIECALLYRVCARFTITILLLRPLKESIIR